METLTTTTRIMITSNSSATATANNLLLLRWRNIAASYFDSTNNKNDHIWFGSEKFNHHHHHLLAAAAGRRRRISPINLHRGFGASIKCFARRQRQRNSGAGGKKKKLTRDDDGEQIRKIQKETSRDEEEYIVGLGDKSSDFNGVSLSSNDNINMDEKNSISTTPSPRGYVLQACTITSGLLFALGLAIRQASHFAYGEGWPVLDCSAQVSSVGFETWHLELITGLVVVISSTRFLLLKTWPDFAESSEAANKQVLSLLQPLDYATVAFLPGISEEVLFRGALLPLFGTNWISALVVSAVFGVLHLGSGRRYSFAVWATCVGLAYSYATIVSGSLIVPMASHALNNLVGGILWRYSTTSISTAEEQEQK